MGLKVGINGFGRIGRNILRAALGNAELDFVAVNDLTDTKTLAHLLKYDSILGNLHQDVTASGDAIHVAGEALKVLSVKDPSELPWKELGVDIVFESTGRFTDRDAAAQSYVIDGAGVSALLAAVAAAGMSPQVNPERWRLRRDPDAQPARGDGKALTAAGS